MLCAVLREPGPGVWVWIQSSEYGVWVDCVGFSEQVAALTLLSHLVFDNGQGAHHEMWWQGKWLDKGGNDDTVGEQGGGLQ